MAMPLGVVFALGHVAPAVLADRAFGCGVRRYGLAVSNGGWNEAANPPFDRVDVDPMRPTCSLSLA